MTDAPLLLAGSWSATATPLEARSPWNVNQDL